MSLRTLLFFALCTTVIKVYSQNTNAITPSVTNGDFEADNFNDWKVSSFSDGTTRNPYNATSDGAFQLYDGTVTTTKTKGAKWNESTSAGHLRSASSRHAYQALTVTPSTTYILEYSYAIKNDMDDTTGGDRIIVQVLDGHYDDGVDAEANANAGYLIKSTADVANGKTNHTVVKETFTSNSSGLISLWIYAVTADEAYIDNVKIYPYNPYPTVLLTENHPLDTVSNGDNVIITASFSKAMQASPTINISGGQANYVAMSATSSSAIWTYNWTVSSTVATNVSITVSGTDTEGYSYTGTDTLSFSIVDQVTPLITNGDFEASNFNDWKVDSFSDNTTRNPYNSTSDGAFQLYDGTVTSTKTKGAKWNESTSAGHLRSTSSRHAYQALTVTPNSPYILEYSYAIGNLVDDTTGGDRLVVHVLNGHFSDGVAAEANANSGYLVKSIGTNANGKTNHTIVQQAFTSNASGLIALWIYAITADEAYIDNIKIYPNDDLTPPTVSLTDSDVDNTVENGDSVVVTATFSEAMNATPTITIGSEISNVEMSPTPSASIWTFNWTVSSTVSTEVAVTVSGSDLAGNAYEGNDSISFDIEVCNLAVGLFSSVTADTFCAGDDVIFTAESNASSVTYSFFINGTLYSSSEAASFTATSGMLLGNDSVTVEISTSAECSATASLTMTMNSTIAGGVFAQTITGENYVCSGELNPSIIVTNTQSSYTSTSSLNVTGTIGSSSVTSTQNLPQGTLSYQWQISDDGETFSDIAGATNDALAPTSAITTLTYFRRVTRSTLNGVVCTTNSNAVSVSVSPESVVLLTYSTSDDGIYSSGNLENILLCEGQSVDLMAVTSGVTVTYKINGVIVQGPSTTTTFTATSLANGDQVSVEVIDASSGCPTESDPLTVVVSAAPEVTLTSSAPNNTFCVDSIDDLVFTATTNDTSPTYEFRINGLAIQNSEQATFTPSGYNLLSGDEVFVKVSSPNGCSFTTSLEMIGIGESAGYAMVEGQNYFVCAGELNPTIVVTDTFSSNISSTINSSTTTSTQGQSQGSLSYQWQVSNDNETFTDIVGATGESLAPTTAITTVTYFRRATNASLNGVVCSTTTNAVMVGVSPDGFALLYSTNNFNPSGGPTQGATATLVVCEGQPIELAASGGATFTFKVNGVVVQGPSATSTFTGTSLVNGDQVSVEVDGGFNGCPSESDPLTIVRTSPAAVGLFSSATNNTLCAGDIVSFTADSSSPESLYTFYVNGLVISGPSQTSSITDNQGLAGNGDVVLVEVTTPGGCSTMASITLSVNSVSGGYGATSSLTLCEGEILPEPIGIIGAQTSGAGSFQWQSSSNNVSFTDIVGATSANYASESAVVSDTYLRRITISTQNGVSCEAVSEPIAIVVDRSIYCNFEDADFDGVANEDDLCPDTPLDTPVDENGCSAEQLDSDLDGILNEADLCPDTPLGVPVNEDGCSEAEVQEKIENGDDDGDGVINILDRCPETPEGAEVDESGCTPEESEAIAQGDEDKDGVINENDVCPDTELGVRVNELGCPLSDYDSDFDGVSDDIDVCPDTEIGAEVDEKGCAAAQIEVDLDLDGVPNEEDLCPDTPLGEKVDEKGCSLAQIEADTDLDGVPNALDICPGTPLEEQADENGCSESQRDDDGDGIPNFIDRCPNTAQGAEIDENGCSALQLDGDDDGDGVLNSVDVCPNTPEGALIDANGCAYKAPKIFKQSFERIENARDDETGEISILLGRILTEDTNAVSTTIGEITLSIEAGEDADLFRLDGNELYLVGRLDYEEQKKHEVIIRATNDKGLSATQKMILKVQDIPNTVTKSNFTVAVFDVKTESSGSKVSYNRYFNPNVERGVGKWKIKKKIVGGADAGAFTIRTRGLDAGDTKSGKSTNTLPQQEDYLDFINPPDFENPQDHNRDNVYEVQVANINTNDGDTQQPISVIQTAIVVPEGDPTAIQLQSVPAAPTDDSDGDGVPDITDNSPFVANPDQSDEDGDGVGDVTDDADHDGVWNPNDTCPDTPYDTLVDVTGCPIFYLPPNNFSVNKAEKCADNNAIFLNIVDTSYTYNVNVTGAENLSETVSSNQWSLNNLSAGTYSICITVDGFTAEDFERCYNVTIAPPAALNVLSQKKQQSEVVTYKLSGGSVYNIYHNGKTIQTDKESYDLKLDPGVNNVKITTGIECQGIFEQNYFHSQRVLYSPLPFNETLNLFVGGDDREVKVEIYNSGSYLVHEQYVQPDPISRTTSIETTQLSSGSYIIKVIGETTLTSQLIIKE